MATALDKFIRRQHDLQQHHISRSFFVSIGLALLLTIGFGGWSILRDYQTSTEQHQRSISAA